MFHEQITHSSTMISPGEEGFRPYYEIRDQINRGTVTKKHDATRVCDYIVPWPSWDPGLVSRCW